MRAVSRWIFLIHRYGGLGLSLLMLMWCLTGIVMLYVPYPSLRESERIAGLPPIDWHRCCVLPANGALQRFSIEMVNGRPLMFGGQTPLDLGSGKPISPITSGDAQAVALNFTRSNGLPSTSSAPEMIPYDQWTVGDFRRDRPIYRVVFHNAAADTLYVSGTTGRVIQRTSRRQRFWNYLGAVPHWLYLTRLRNQPALWAQVLIWTSLGGCFLVATGLYAGVRQWLRARRAQRWSPYHGFAWWHHVPGLAFGVILFTWIFSGLLSMNPWGLLESRDNGRAAASLSGPPIPFAKIGTSLQAIAAKRESEAIRMLTAAPLNGRLYIIATQADGTRRRWDEAGLDAPLKPADLDFIAGQLAPDVQPTLLQSGDDYYFDFDGGSTAPPAWRLIAGNRDRYYVDAVSGSLVRKMDATARANRWWFQGLHRLDFTSVLRARPLWDVVVVILLLGASLIAATGSWMALKFLFRARRSGLR
jgi:hypothetical protein